MTLRLTLAGLLVTCASASASAQSADADDVNKQQVVPETSAIPQPGKGYGTIVGQFVFDGEVPEKELLHKAGNPDVKDGATCASADQYKNDLLINAKNKGLRNVFIYMKSAKKVHPDLKASKKDQVIFDQKNCRFSPKALLVRTDQKVLVLSDDPVAHNTHTFPIRNQGVNILVAPNDRDGSPIANPKPELLPIEVKCDLHPWMKSHWLILDHPYMAVSNADGRFMIANLPEGRHELRLWHERVGYVHKKMSNMKSGNAEVKSKKFYVTVEDGKVTDIGQLKLKADWFKG